MRKLLSFVTILVLSLMLTAPVAADAAAVKINKTKLTLDEGATYPLKISGTSKSVKWSTSNEKVATVSDNGKVKAIKKGTATITAVVNKNKYLCKVTVREVFNSSNAIKNIEIDSNDRGKGVISILKNNYSFPVSLSATIVYYDENDQMLGKSEENNYYFDKGRECVLFFGAPYDKNYNDVEYERYEIKLSVSETINKKSNVSDIKTKSNIGADNIMIEVTNSGEKATDYTEIYVLFYKNGNLEGCSNQYADVKEPGSTDYLEFSFPYDQNYNTISIDDYKVFVNCSYYYSW